MLSHRVISSAPAAAARADAGDCFERHGHALCLPSLVNIGVQKAGTGELQTWLGVHPQVHVHGGEVHFFDGLHYKAEALRCGRSTRGRMRLEYARYLWQRRPLPSAAAPRR